MNNNISEVCLEAVDKLSYIANKSVAQGKRLVEMAALQKRLASSQRQLGALVYSLNKRGEENTLLVSRYIENITRIEQQLEQIAGKSGASEVVQNYIICAICGCKCKKSSAFCPSCGEHI